MIEEINKEKDLKFINNLIEEFKDFESIHETLLFTKQQMIGR